MVDGRWLRVERVRGSGIFILIVVEIFVFWDEDRDEDVFGLAPAVAAAVRRW